MTTLADRRRLLMVACTVFLLFCLLILQFYKIQILENDLWSKLADRQHYLMVKDPFFRGTFYANSAPKKAHPENMQKLVVDIEKSHLYIDPLSIPEKHRNEIAESLIAILQVPQEGKLAFKREFYKKSRSRKVALWLEPETKEAITDFWLPFAKEWRIPRNALYFVSDYQRSYPFGKLLGQVLHTVQWQKNEKTGQAIPTGGLELYFDRHLQGKTGLRRLMRSPRHAMEIGDVVSVPENGADIYLTIDYVLQAIAEEELEKGVKKFKAKSGTAVMMDPFTGEILVLAQYPFFYPEDYQKYFNDPALLEHAKIKSIVDTNEPGSSIKPITIAIALMANAILIQRGEKPLFEPEEKIATANGKFPGRSKPIVDSHLHYALNMDMALKHSSNIYVARLVERIVERLGNEWYRKQLQEAFGFGLKTGIELPSESAGFLPTPKKTYINGALEWSIPTPFSLAFGYNLLATSVQMARAYAVLANGGKLVKPTLVQKIVRGNDLLLNRFYSEEFPQKVPPQIIQRVVKSLKFTTKPGGTARKADIYGYTEAGKTSTSKKIVNGAYSERSYVSGFAGFAPAGHPAFVLNITLDEPEYGYIPGLGKNHNGGTSAAPIFREIATRSLEYLGIAKDDPYGYPSPDPRYSRDGDWLDENRRLQEMYEKWNNKGKKEDLRL